jgi:hypothetical protein
MQYRQGGGLEQLATAPPRAGSPETARSNAMRNLSTIVWTLAAILLVLWIAGLVAGATYGGLLHVLLILIVLSIVIGLIPRRRA